MQCTTVRNIPNVHAYFTPHLKSVLKTFYVGPITRSLHTERVRSDLKVLRTGFWLHPWLYDAWTCPCNQIKGWLRINNGPGRSKHGVSQPTSAKFLVSGLIRSEGKGGWNFAKFCMPALKRRYFTRPGGGGGDGVAGRVQFSSKLKLLYKFFRMHPDVNWKF